MTADDPAILRTWPAELGRRTLLMGVINVTPDSFSGDGLFSRPGAAAEAAERLAAAGADLIDVGGESTRPGYVPVPLEEELRRVLPAIESIVRRVGVPISIDTSKAEVARRALAAGASVVNDVSGLRDPDMAPCVAEEGAPLVLVHRGAAGPGEDVVAIVRRDLERQIDVARVAGIPPRRLMIDPGLGMGKGWRDNLDVMRRLPELRALGRPILVGPSRKGMIGRVLGVEAGDRLEGTAALVALCIANGAAMVRVHDVAYMARVARTMDSLARPLS